ncbi:hypothetical protein [Oceanisphaera sp. KMM 10153]|uniref:hypothetical protein n=1 Tax=Oceanisphaera submarina TaxID=3390193 RepID=UPI00397477F4
MNTPEHISRIIERLDPVDREALEQHLAERTDQIRLGAINHFADIFSEAVESGFVELDEKLAADFERTIRQHGHDNYHPDGIIKRMNREAQ